MVLKLLTTFKLLDFRTTEVLLHIYIYIERERTHCQKCVKKRNESLLLFQEVVQRVDRFSNKSCIDDSENVDSIYNEDVPLAYTIQVPVLRVCMCMCVLMSILVVGMHSSNAL